MSRLPAVRGRIKQPELLKGTYQKFVATSVGEIQALARLNLNSTESVEAVQHVGTYIRVVACSLDYVRGGAVHVHGNGSGRGHCVA